LLSPSQFRYLVTFIVNSVYNFLFIYLVCWIIVLTSVEREENCISVLAQGVCKCSSGSAEQDEEGLLLYQENWLALCMWYPAHQTQQAIGAISAWLFWYRNWKVQVQWPTHWYHAFGTKGYRLAQFWACS
jgi:hypothetical protein